MTPPSSSVIGRRQFLLSASACALSPAVLASPAVAQAPAPPPEPLTVGYWRGEGDPLSSPELAPVSVVPAESLATGEAQLATSGVRITVHGLLGEAGETGRAAAPGVRSAALRVDFPTARFHPWCVTAGPLCPASCPASHAIDFVVPLEAGGGLDLALELDRDATAGDRMRRVLLGRSAREFTAHLALGRGHGRPKLRQGYYFVPLRQEGFRGWHAAAEEPAILVSVAAA